VSVTIGISLEVANKVAYQRQRVELRSAFSNLVFNAVKYTPDRG